MLLPCLGNPQVMLEGEPLISQADEQVIVQFRNKNGLENPHQGIIHGWLGLDARPAARRCPTRGKAAPVLEGR